MSHRDLRVLLDEILEQFKTLEGDKARTAKLYCIVNLLQGTDSIEALGLIITAASMILSGNSAESLFYTV